MGAHVSNRRLTPAATCYRRIRGLERDTEISVAKQRPAVATGVSLWVVADKLQQSREGGDRIRSYAYTASSSSDCCSLACWAFITCAASAIACAISSKAA